ncbi:hypothetical protein [Phenylobacterium sp.]|jgi:uncharacterized protein YecT (DUF1311 family)|uniref:lysozyme inhibitor LprI family protein n=1 Tax=Phenylobacterium sp. TaxID=1871053 RepID=UPI002F93D8CD
MPTHRTGEPWGGATYNGFAGPAPATPAAAPPHRESITKKTLLGGLAAATAAGLLFGLWARPEFGEDGRAREPMKAVAPVPAEAPATQVAIEVMPPVITPAPEAPAPLEVMPQDLARAAEASRPVIAPAPVVRRPPPVQVARAVPQSPASAVVREAPPARTAVVREAPPARTAVVRPQPLPQTASVDRDVRPSFNCRYARSRSEQLVCGDSELAMLDRRLNRAFDRAVGSGIPYRELRREQDDWLSIREDAARRSPEAVASVYRQRIRELNAIAEDDF